MGIQLAILDAERITRRPPANLRSVGLLRNTRRYFEANWVINSYLDRSN